MKVAVVLICTLAAICHVLSAPQMRADGDEQMSEYVLEKAVPCHETLCIAPDCRCSSTVLDSTIPIQNTPQVRLLQQFFYNLWVKSKSKHKIYWQVQERVL